MNRVIILIWFVLLILFFPLIGLSHTIELITGESIEGKFVKGDTQSVTIRTGKVEKKIPITSILRITFKGNLDRETKGKAFKNGTLKGIVTYLFNDNFGDKPDVGSKVYAIPTSRNWGKESDLSSISEEESFVKDLKGYYSANTLRNIVALDMIMGEPVSENYVKELQKMGADTEEGFKLIDEKARKNLFKIKFGEILSSHAVVDGDGQFELQLVPGSYFIVVLSNHRNQHTLTEHSHSLYIN